MCCTQWQQSIWYVDDHDQDFFGDHDWDSFDDHDQDFVDDHDRDVLMIMIEIFDDHDRDFLVIMIEIFLMIMIERVIMIAMIVMVLPTFVSLPLLPAESWEEKSHWISYIWHIWHFLSWILTWFTGGNKEGLIFAWLLNNGDLKNLVSTFESDQLESSTMVMIVTLAWKEGISFYILKNFLYPYFR